eukprot:maker-scaffold_2-snap-gene-12.1-mRNA-1 protein AED:0.16 eAED:0.16 QI:98/0.5/0.33/1/1/1/3/0/368
MSNEAAFEQITDFSGWHVRTIVKDCKPLDVHIRFPENFNINADEHKVMVYLPGSNRNVTSATGNNLINRADEYRVVLIGIHAEDSDEELDEGECPEKIDRFKYFRHPEGYQWNNVGEHIETRRREYWERPYNETDYVSSYIENAFLVVREEIGLKADGFHYYGHSAGAQVVLRHILLNNLNSMSLIKAACAANSNSYTYSTFTQDYGESFPYIFDEAVFSEERIEEFYSQLVIKVQEVDLTIALGDQDLDEVGDRNSVSDQGLTRFERGNNYFSYLANETFLEEMEDYINFEDYANWTSKFKWKKLIVEGAEHNTHHMLPACFGALFQDAPTFEESWIDQLTRLIEEYPMYALASSLGLEKEKRKKNT